MAKRRSRRLIETRGGRIRLQDTKGKHSHEGDLLAGRKLGGVQGLHRQHQDDDIGCDAESCVGVPVLRDINARSGNRLVPRTADRRALPDGRAEGGDHIGADDAQESVAGHLEPFLREDTQVEEQDRCLGQVDGELVECLGDVEELRLQKTGQWATLSFKVVIRVKHALSRS